ncbi:50S ribosomal protein L22 [Propionibacterium freudenreichii]|uniref:Large ribosomal subunit protein uL22 n=1 Tax=Propionibacterium freudenreichii subsp. freudenreichii TaxID=66712 RepID=A0A0B7NSA4_PROFF|nr:50S ribosomal protein L22 [Propionibacterium freudenreichii]MCT2980157.1 50S ribosomal protein L22 [Propionibacterium freudenreichii]CEI32908.1 50S ribosomal protein L22 [Propionibacterium freudenreichii]CEP25611.1 50S ribosomal protein L22 [Propionibacterium freudenreichii subsp. freudenreichii]
MSNTTQRPSRRVALLGDRPGSYAIARHVRMSAQKVRRVADTVRGMDATQAIATLHFAPQAAAEPVRKVIESAVANAETSEGLHNEQLVISQIYVDEGVTMRRIRPRAKGSASRILKRASHITAVVEPAETAGHPPLKKASSAKNSSKATAADTTSDDTKEA